MDTPSELMKAFSHAFAAGDMAALEALCTLKGLSSRGESVGRLLRQRTRQQVSWTPLAELVEGDKRAAVCGLLNDPEGGRVHGKLWLNAVKSDRWRLEGCTKYDRAAALFAAGVLPPIFAPDELPESEAARDWALGVLGHLQAGSALDPIVVGGLERLEHDTVGVLDVIACYQIAAIGRHVAGIGRRHGHDDVRQTTWFALEGGPSNALQVIGHRSGAGAALLLSVPTG